MRNVDAVVLGGGYYGCRVAVALKTLGLRRVILLEPRPIGTVATACNQNRIHSGLHYCRHNATAAAAQKNYLRFLSDHAPTIRGNSRHVYAIAEGSLTTPEQFEAHARAIGAKITPLAISKYTADELWFTDKILAAYTVDELSFDIDAMREFLGQQLKQARVEVVKSNGIIGHIHSDGVDVLIDHDLLRADYVFNCTYGNIDRVGVPIRTRLKKELTEVCLVHPPPELFGTDITVMDGMFWSMMEYPSHSCHALTHVKYTPHRDWHPPEEPEEIGDEETNFEKMRRDAAQHVPLMDKCKYVDSMWTTRVVLADNEADDGRPVLWEHAEQSPRIVSILGSKFGSIYDVLDRLQETMGPPAKTCIRVVGRRALIGRGFVGSNLDKPGRFTDRYHSKNIHEMRGHYQQIVIAAPSAEKWRANGNPAVDAASVERLIDALRQTTADDMVLISTIDVYGNTKYGQHRRELETMVRTEFPHARIIRLPALYGPGLKKNALYDLLTGHPLSIPADSYQWFDVRQLWECLNGVGAGITLDICPAPVSMGWIAEQVGAYLEPCERAPIKYDHQFAGGYFDTEEEVKAGLLKFIQEYKR